MKIISVLFVPLFLICACACTAQAIEAGNVEIHGFVSQGYLLTNHNNYMADTDGGTFQFNEMGVNFSTDLANLLHIAVQVFSRDLGDVGNNDVVLGYAYGDYRWKDWLGIRAGKIKIDYGLYNETREMDMLRTTVMLPQSVYSEIWRDSFSNLNGAGLYGYVPAGAVGKFAYNFQIGAMEFNKDGGFAKSFSPKLDETLSLTKMDADYAWFGTLQWQPPIPGLKLKATDYSINGLSAQGNVSVTDKTGNEISSSVTFDVTQKDGYVLSLEYSWKNLILTAEYSEDNYQVDHTIDRTAAPPDTQAGNSPQGGGNPM
ncbi:MAG: hypothetical protein HC887_11080, partial [Desulfobacteraceae bacterium]|nr:hypothetical protein [Desulfobacteraceae bacterium]